MSINPGSDIVLDVMKAADPTRAQQVTARLDQLGSMSPADAAAFAKALGGAGSTDQASFYADMRDQVSGKATSDAKAVKAKTGFEAAIIDNFVKEMLPKDASGVYGQGQAGDIWRSMLSEQISNQIAKSGELGIAKKLFATHALHSHGKADLSVSQDPGKVSADAVQASENQLSIAPSGKIADGAVLFASKAST